MSSSNQTNADHDADYCAWLTANVALLRAGRLSDIDAGQIGEELLDQDIWPD